MHAALMRLHSALATGESLDDAMRSKVPIATSAHQPLPRRRDDHVATRSFEAVASDAVAACRKVRKRLRDEGGAEVDDLSDAGLSQLTRFTKEIALEPFRHFLHYGVSRASSPRGYL